MFNDVGILVLIFLPYRISVGDGNGYQVEVFLGLTEPFGSPYLTVLLFPRLFLLSQPYVL